MKKTIKTTNRDVRQYVESMQNFTGNNIRGLWIGKSLYVVFSYNTPIFAFDAKQERWVRNIEKYSVTTSRHVNQCQPCTFTGCSIEEMLRDKIRLAVESENCA